MANVFLLQNQDKRLFDKHGSWCDGREATQLFRTAHKDEAINQMVEANSKDYTLRIKLLECATNERGIPQISDQDLPPMDAPVIPEELSACANDEAEERIALIAHVDIAETES